jgi:hypothetical protein
MKYPTTGDQKKEEKAILKKAREVTTHGIARINKKQWRKSLITTIFVLTR